jgi:hypothetical protein
MVRHRGAEPGMDFIHKNSIVLIELKETKISLQLSEQSLDENNKSEIKCCQQISDQLSAVFYRTAETAKSKNP